MASVPVAWMGVHFDKIEKKMTRTQKKALFAAGDKPDIIIINLIVGFV